MNTAKNTESSSVVLLWDEVDDSLNTTYRITWTSNGTNSIQSHTLIEQSSYIITGLTLDTFYTITVTASNKCGTGSEYSTSVLFTTNTTSTSMIYMSHSITNPVATVFISTPSITTTDVDRSPASTANPADETSKFSTISICS